MALRVRVMASRPRYLPWRRSKWHVPNAGRKYLETRPFSVPLLNARSAPRKSTSLNQHRTVLQRLLKFRLQLTMPPKLRRAIPVHSQSHLATMRRRSPTPKPENCSRHLPVKAFPRSNSRKEPESSESSTILRKAMRKANAALCPLPCLVRFRWFLQFSVS